MSCKEWKEYTLESVCTEITDGSHASPKSVECGYPMASVKDMNYFRINIDTCRKISEEDYAKLVKGKCKPQINDVLIAKDGSYMKHVNVIKEENNIVLLSSIAILRPNLKLINPYFLKYYLLTPNTKNELEQSYVSGSAIRRIVLKDFKRFPISLPKLEEQEKIANILSSLDDKIELNNEMNKTLEDMAQSIFKRWFVDFEFPNEDGDPYKSSGGEMVDSELGMIPKGWEVKTIADIGDVISGGTPSTKNEEYYGGDISWITPKDLSGYDRKFISKGERSITEIGLQKSSAKLLPRGTVLFSSRAPIGYVAIAQQEVCTNQGFKSIVCNKDIINNNYIYYFLKYNKENIENVSSGSTFKEISGTHMKNIKIIVPIKNILDKFNGVIESFDKLLDKNYMDIDILAEVRDNLLPKLMSGELELSK
ncbi:restriction endonuclease subunit S [Paeniclostridium sordellii]|nr:restriction endonuclease subunit S [Paeniclostridium sordellii]